MIISCSGKHCHLSCKTEGLEPTVKTLTCINAMKRRWQPTAKKVGPISCQDQSTMNLCGKITDLYRFEDNAKVSCDGGKTCSVTCPANLVPNKATLTCLNKKRQKMAPPKVTKNAYDMELKFFQTYFKYSV